MFLLIYGTSTYGIPNTKNTYAVKQLQYINIKLVLLTLLLNFFSNTLNYSIS